LSLSRTNDSSVNLTCLVTALAFLTAAVGSGCSRAELQQAQEGPPVSAPAEEGPAVVEQVYMGLSSGPLRQAQLAEMPEGTVLRAGDIVITEQQVREAIAKAEPQVRAMLKKNAFLVAEKMATKELLLAEARAWAKAAPSAETDQSEDNLIQRYLESIAEQATVTDEDLRAFYEANPDMFGGATYDQVKSELRDYLTSQKQNERVEAHLNGLSERTPVQVSASWVKTQAALALDNPVDKARRSGKPAIVDFGSEGCGPCDMMAPILEELREKYKDQCHVLFVKVTEEPILAARYGIQSIPVQVFFDRDGKEAFRHVGFFPKEQMLAHLAEVGVK
jgi:thiol-disulfide isomerase/thioredoxin